MPIIRNIPEDRFDRQITPPRPAGSRLARRGTKHRFSLAVAAAVGGAATFGALQLAPVTHSAAAAAAPVTSAQQVPASAAAAPVWPTVAAKAAPSVVAIQVAGASAGDQGSGVVWDSRGDIVTNNHVVSSQGPGAHISVRIGAQDTYRATIVGTDPGADLAVIRLTNAPTGLVPIRRGNSAALHVGDPVMALGNPLGLSGTVTNGIISALDRPVATAQVPAPSTVPMGDTSSSSSPVVTDAIQTNAAINPGNSGGALVDSTGQLIGINSAIASLGTSAGGGQSGNIGIGFAIPVNEVSSVADQLIATGQSNLPFLGVSTSDAAFSHGAAQISGAGVVAVSAGSPAATAGLRSGDVITAVNGVPVDSSTSLMARIRSQAPKATVTITVHRGTQSMDKQVTLGSKAA